MARYFPEVILMELSSTWTCKDACKGKRILCESKTNRSALQFLVQFICYQHSLKEVYFLMQRHFTKGTCKTLISFTGHFQQINKNVT